jgi:hypothetical protein
MTYLGSHGVYGMGHLADFIFPVRFDRMAVIPLCYVARPCDQLLYGPVNEHKQKGDDDR